MLHILHVRKFYQTGLSFEWKMTNIWFGKWKEKTAGSKIIFLFFGGLVCVSHSFANVANLLISGMS
jgi:hypothetical protein